MYNRNEIIEENNLTYVDGISAGDLYNWAEIEVYYSKEKRRYFWLSGEGCSCEGLWDEISTIEDLCNGSRKNAADALRSFIAEKKEYGYGDISFATSKLLGN